LGGGYRDIHVSLAAATDARVALATVEPLTEHADDPPTRPVGLERSSLRVVGKAAAALIVVSWSGVSGLVVAFTGSSVVLPLLVVTLLVVVAMVGWSELRRSASGGPLPPSSRRGTAAKNGP